MDPLEKLSDEQLVLLSADVEVQLEARHSSGHRPIVYLLAMQRQRATAAIAGIINADPEDAKVIRGFQQEIALYHDLIGHCRELLTRGREADRNISEQERAALADAIEGMSDEERNALKIEPRGDD